MRFFKYTCILLFSVCAVCAKAQVPTPTIVNAYPLICTDRLVTFTAQGIAEGTSVHWAITPSLAVTWPQDSTGTELTFKVSNADLYTVAVSAVSGTASARASKPFTVYKSAKASFNASLSGQGFPAQLTLTDYSSFSNKHYWIFDGNAESKDSSAHLVRNYTSSGTFSVMLLSLGANGCDDQSVYAFHIADSSGVTLPNIFTPNGDNVNDVYRPVVRGIASLNAWVYNRSGVIIASWDKVNGSWDGYTTSGEPCVAGVYFIVLEATGFDNKQFKLKSTITLLR